MANVTVLNASSDLTGFKILELQLELDWLKENLDVFFLIVMGAMILFLQAAFAFLEVGFVRTKNVTSLLLCNYLDTGISSICYWLVGYALAYGEGNAFCGTRYFAAVGLPYARYPHWFFQFTFVATASTIMTGSLAERCTLATYFSYSVLISGFLYPIITHWTWSDVGWLRRLGFVDFAGSCVVHFAGGCASLVGSYFLGPRFNRFTRSGNVTEIRPHSVPFITLGYFVLLFGILAFNGGSQGSITKPGDGQVAARAVINTLISLSAAALTALLFNRFYLDRINQSWSILTAINGSITGMVAVCAGCNQYQPWAAFLLGCAAAFFYFFCQKIELLMKIDDPVDAAPIHMGGGMLGTIAVRLIGDEGVLVRPTAANAMGLLVNLLGIVCVFLWIGFFMAVLFKILIYTNRHRVSPTTEKIGTDYSITREPAYCFSVRDLNDRLQWTLDENKKAAMEGFYAWPENFW